MLRCLVPIAVGLVAVVGTLAGCTSLTSSGHVPSGDQQPVGTPLRTELSALAPADWTQQTLGSPPTEPRADIPPGPSCNGQLAVAKVSAFFDALNRADLAAVDRLFAADGNWEDFEVIPSIAGVIANGYTLNGPGDIATAHGQLAVVMSRLKGLHFKFYPAAFDHGGPSYTSTYGTELGVGPILWVATGPALEQHGKRVIFGGGKAGLLCTGGRFVKVGLGALKLA